MTMYEIINYMKASGQDAIAMCIYRSAISNAIWIAKGEEMPRSEYTYEQRSNRFYSYLGKLKTMQRMWNATRPENRWSNEDEERTEILLSQIWYKYNL